MSATNIQDSEFEEKVLQADKPVLVDFWAEWCGPCKQIGPSLEELASEMKEQVTIAKLNIDDNPQTPNKYGVRGIPTMLLFKNGEVSAMKVGALPKLKIKEWIEESLA
ncbi:MAG: thioredoxin TrxA [Pseudomonadota bacterium]